MNYHRIVACTMVGFGVALWPAPSSAVPPVRTVAQSRGVPPGVAPTTGHEREPVDAWIPRQTVALPGVVDRCDPVVRGPYQSIQVNVDRRGCNIVGDAANEPSIAIDPTDPRKIVIGWRQFDSVESDFRQAGWAYSHDAGHTWKFPGVLAPGVFRSDPVLDVGPDGTIYYFGVGLRIFESIHISWDGGITWGESGEVRTADKPWMTVDRTQGIGRGNIYTFSQPTTFSRSTDGGTTFMEPIYVVAPPLPTMSVAPDGTLYVVGEASVVARSSNAKDPTQVPVFEHRTFIELGGSMMLGGSPNPGGLLGQTWIATDHSEGPSRGNVYVLGSIYNLGEHELDVRFSRSTDAGLNWSDAVRVNDDPEGNGAWQWFAMMSVAPNGRIDAAWNDTRNHLDAPEANLSELYYAYSTDAGVSWSKNISVSPVFDSYVGWPAGQAKIGDYYHMISDNLGVNIAYAATFNGEQDVYFLRVGPWDCNGNEIPDDCDIDCNAPGCTVPVCKPGEPDQPCIGGADYTGITDYLVSPLCGTSLDCNANDVPDECEYRGDFDGNGLTNLRDLSALQRCFTGDLPATSGDRTDSVRSRYGDVGLGRTAPLPDGRGTDPPDGVSANGLAPCCALFDLEPDGDVDLEDHTAILRVLSGP